MIPAAPREAARPLRWLGAPSPGGLALPAAQPTAGQLYGPRGVWLEDERLIVCDTGNHRVLIWHGIPREDHAAADVVLGQATFADEGPAGGGRGPGNGFRLPTGVLVSAGRLMVADAWHHRIVVWNRVPDRSDTPPDWCLGQDSLLDVERNRGRAAGADTFFWPFGLAVIAGRLHVADTGNRRVLIWDGVPASDSPAAVVLGQSDMRSTEENRGGPPGAASFRWPHAIAGDSRTVFVADAGDHRVLGWRGEERRDRSADLVLGQPDFLACDEFPSRPQGPSRLRFPYGLTSGRDGAGEEVLLAADTANNRVLVWGLPIGEDRLAAARAAVGQPDFFSTGENHWRAVTAETLCWPYAVCLDRGRLAIADSGNNRVMIWSL